MEPLLPSEIARLVYGYLKNETNEEVAECFLKSSPHLTECYQMFKANRKFNIKVNGLNLNNLFDIFGTMCSMINARTSGVYESKTLIEKLQYLLNTNHIPNKRDIGVETEINLVNKCVGNMIITEDKCTHTSIHIETNKSTIEVLEAPSFVDMISNNISKTKETETISNDTIITVENNLIPNSSLSSPSQCVTTPNISKIDDKESPQFKINKQTCSTPVNKAEEIKHNIESSLQLSPKINQDAFNQPEYQQIPEAISQSIPELSKEDRSKDNSIVIDTGELVDTFLNDQSLLEKIANTINKSIETQKDIIGQDDNILDPPTLEKALDSTQSDPQIKNVLDEFLVFNVDNNTDDNKNKQENCIKSRLRSAKKKDDGLPKLKKNNLNTPKNILLANDDCKNIDNSITLINEGNIRSTLFENYKILSNHVILQANNYNSGQLLNYTTPEIEPDQEEDDYVNRGIYVKIAPKPKRTPSLKTHQTIEKRIFPKRKKRSLEEFGIQSKFRRTNIITTLPTQPPKIVQSTQSIIIEVPNQSSFETQGKNNMEINNITLPEVSKKLSEVKDTVIVHDTPDDRLKPPKSKSLSTPRRRSTHIRCLDFSTPQPKNNTRDQARSKLFCDTPKKFENIVEENTIIDSPLPKLQADWGSVNGFESIVRKETSKHWDSDIREMVGAGILTSDADTDVRKYRKKKTPKKKIKQANDKNNLHEEKNISSKANKSHSDETNKTDISVKNVQCNLNSTNSDSPLIDDQKSLNELNEFPISLETPDKAIVLCKEQLPSESNNLKLLKTQTEFPISLETPDKMTELFKEQPSTESSSFKNFNDLNFSNQQNEFPISLETPDKITELCKEQSSVESNSLNSLNDVKSLKKQSEFPISLETTDKITELFKEQSPNNSNSLKNFNNKKSLKNHSEFDLSHQSILFETPDKVLQMSKNQSKIESSSLKISCKSQIIPELSVTNVTKQENKLNISTVENKLSNNSTTPKTMSPIITKTSEEKDSNFLESFNNINDLKPLSIKQPENKLKQQTGKQSILDQIVTHNSSDKSPIKLKTQTIKHNMIETPYKCDDAVDVPETPISKLIREYDPSKLITPLPCTPIHYEDSLTETPLTKVFRETSYLNRPPISPFPPTPGNSRSVDTLIVPSEQENSRNFNNSNTKINSLKEPSILITCNNEILVNSNKKKPIKPSKKNVKLSSKTKKKSCIKEKNVEAKKKQVYETVKVELFGSEISSSLSANELENTVKKSKYIIPNKKCQEDEKTSGFKPIPKRKLTQSTSATVDGVENYSLDECNKSLNNCPSMKSTTTNILQCKKSSLEKAKNKSIIKQSNKSKKNMVHFDDPVEQFFKLSTNQNLSKSISKNNSKIKDNTEINQETTPLIGLSRYLNKSDIFNECNTKEKKVIKTEPEIMTSKLNNSDTSINYLKNYNTNRSDEKISNPSLKCLNNKIKPHNISNQGNKSFSNSITDIKENNTIPNKFNIPLKCEQSIISNIKTSDESYNSKEINNSSLQISKQNQSESTTINHNIKNTSCVTIGHTDESFQLSKIDDPLKSLEYLKKTKIYEVITEDGEREMVYLNLSESFTFLDIPSELDNESSLNPVTAPLITNKLLNVTPEIECDRLEKNVNKIPVTSTPKDFIEKKIDERQERARRSPSFWDDSLHNYPAKYRDDKHWESNRRENKNYRDNRYNHKSWTKRSSHQNYLQRNVYDERDFRDDSIKDKNRFKHYKEDNRRSYHSYNYDELYTRHYGQNRLDDPERLSNTQRISQYDSYKPNRTEEIVKKATKRSADRADYNKTSAKVSKVEHQRLLKNVDVDDFLSVVHGRKSK